MKRELEEPIELPPEKYLKVEDGSGISVKTEHYNLLIEYSNQNEVLSSLPQCLVRN
jgi:hypothetical protein